MARLLGKPVLSRTRLVMSFRFFHFSNTHYWFAFGFCQITDLRVRTIGVPGIWPLLFFALWKDLGGLVILIFKERGEEILVCC